MLNIRREFYPGILGLLPKRDGWGREVRIIEGPNSNAIVIGPNIKGPAHRTPTSRAEVVLELAAVPRIAGIDPVLTLKLDC